LVFVGGFNLVERFDGDYRGKEKLLMSYRIRFGGFEGVIKKASA